MKKLVKPEKPIEAFSEEIVKAFCEYEGCKPNCRIDDSSNRCRSRCTSVGGFDNDEDILF